MASTFKYIPASSGGVAAGVDSFNGRDGVVTGQSGDYYAGIIDFTPAGSIAATDVQDAIEELDAEKQTIIPGNNNFLIQKDNSGIVQGADALSVNTVTKGLIYSRNYQPNADGGYIMNDFGVSLDPLQNSPSDSFTVMRSDASLDPNSSGFQLGTSGSSVNLYTGNVSHQGTSDVGDINLLSYSMEVGNDVDPIDVGGMSLVSMGGSIHSNVTMVGPLQGYGMQFNMQAGSQFDLNNSTVNGFYDFSNVQAEVPNWQSFIASPTILEVANNKNVIGLQAVPNIDTFNGNSGYFGLVLSGSFDTFNTGGYFGLNVNPNISNPGTGSFYGASINPTIATSRNATGIDVNMSNVTPYAGVASQLVIQDLTLEFALVGDNNAFTVEYVDDTTAGSETATLLGNAITVHIESGVSTATQVKAALDANVNIFTNINTTISGVASDPQVTQAATNFASGENPGNVKAANFTGDVSITGSLSFSGALSIGKLSAFHQQAVIDGGGTPSTIHSLISSPTVADGQTITNIDTIGVNTASLMTIGTGCTLTSGGFGLGLTSLALPTILTIGAGSTLDNASGGTFAISMGGGTGTVDKIKGSRSVLVGDGTTTINRFYAYSGEVLGASATENWGIHADSVEYNYMKSLKINGTNGSTDKVANSDIGLEVEDRLAVIGRGSAATRDAKTAINGSMWYNTDTNKFQGYASGAWVDLH